MKRLLMFSVSVFLLASAWTMLMLTGCTTDDPVSPAQAQVTLNPNRVVAAFSSPFLTENVPSRRLPIFAVTETGEVWTTSLNMNEDGAIANNFGSTTQLGNIVIQPAF